MDLSEWTHVGLDLLGMLIVGFAFVWAIKTDTKVLATRLKGVEDRLTKVDGILEKLSDQKSRIDVIDERMLAQGKRVDELVKMISQIGMRYNVLNPPPGGK